jgi:hypothetical protein
MELGRRRPERLSFFRPDIFFNGHVFELTGFKNIATFLAFNELSVFIASDDTHAWMPADFLHRDFVGEPVYERWILTRVHIRIKAHCHGCLCTNWPYFKPVLWLVKCLAGTGAVRTGHNG